jgi:hypothetical protein
MVLLAGPAPPLVKFHVHVSVTGAPAGCRQPTNAVRICVRDPLIVPAAGVVSMYGKRHSSASVGADAVCVVPPPGTGICVVTARPPVARTGICPGAILRLRVPIGSKIVR